MLGTHLQQPSQRAIQGVRNSSVHITVIAMAVVILLVISTKAYFARGTPMRGGLPSGHAAIAFGGWAAITFVTQGSSNQVLISTLAFVMALLVVQTRVEARGAHDHGGGVRRGARRDGDRGDLPDLWVGLSCDRFVTGSV